jgi:ATP-dependent DNA helicase RecG
MNRDELLQIAARGESETLELKSSTAELDAGMQAACAMLNTGSSGVLLFGVTDTGEVRGQEIGDQTMERVANAIRRIEPMADPRISTTMLDNGRSVIAIRLPASERTHTFDGIPYQRLGKSTSRMPTTLFQRRFVEEAHRADSWEDRPAIGYTTADLDHKQILSSVQESIRRQRLTDPITRDIDELLLGLGLIRDGVPLNAAMVLFARENRLLPDYPQCMLRVARFRGTTKSEFRDNRQYIGNAFELFMRAQQFWIDYLPIAGRIVPDQIARIDEPLYPTESLREAMANAICHRDYAVRGANIDLAIYDDRLEITSPGPLRFGLEPEDLLVPHESKRWNPLIASVFYRQGIIESWGSGTLKMIELNQSAGIPAPEFIATQHSFTVRFRPTAYIAPSRVETNLSQLQQDILNTLAHSGPVPLRKLVELVPGEIPLRTVQDNLQILRSLGLVDFYGNARAARWSLRAIVV